TTSIAVGESPGPGEVPVTGEPAGGAQARPGGERSRDTAPGWWRAVRRGRRPAGRAVGPRPVPAPVLRRTGRSTGSGAPGRPAAVRNTGRRRRPRACWPPPAGPVPGRPAPTR